MHIAKKRKQSKKIKTQPEQLDSHSSMSTTSGDDT
jgi:hypothetical protein